MFGFEGVKLKASFITRAESETLRHRKRLLTINCFTTVSYSHTLGLLAAVGPPNATEDEEADAVGFLLPAAPTAVPPFGFS